MGEKDSFRSGTKYVKTQYSIKPPLSGVAVDYPEQTDTICRDIKGRDRLGIILHAKEIAFF